LFREKNRRKEGEESIGLRIGFSKKGKEIKGFPHMHLKAGEILKRRVTANMFLQPQRETRSIM
jgi:hypothetical protein